MLERKIQWSITFVILAQDLPKLPWEIIIKSRFLSMIWSTICPSLDGLQIIRIKRAFFKILFIQVLAPLKIQRVLGL